MSRMSTQIPKPRGVSYVRPPLTARQQAGQPEGTDDEYLFDPVTRQYVVRKTTAQQRATGRPTGAPANQQFEKGPDGAWRVAGSSVDANTPLYVPKVQPFTPPAAPSPAGAFNRAASQPMWPNGGRTPKGQRTTYDPNYDPNALIPGATVPPTPIGPMTPEGTRTEIDPATGGKVSYVTKHKPGPYEWDNGKQVSGPGVDASKQAVTTIVRHDTETPGFQNVESPQPGKNTVEFIDPNTGKPRQVFANNDTQGLVPDTQDNARLRERFDLVMKQPGMTADKAKQIVYGTGPTPSDVPRSQEQAMRDAGLPSSPIGPDGKPVAATGNAAVNGDATNRREALELIARGADPTQADAIVGARNDKRKAGQLPAFAPDATLDQKVDLLEISGDSAGSQHASPQTPFERGEHLRRQVRGNAARMQPQRKEQYLRDQVVRFNPDRFALPPEAATQARTLKSWVLRDGGDPNEAFSQLMDIVKAYAPNEVTAREKAQAAERRRQEDEKARQTRDDTRYEREQARTDYNDQTKRWDDEGKSLSEDIRGAEKELDDLLRDQRSEAIPSQKTQYGKAIGDARKRLGDLRTSKQEWYGRRPKRSDEEGRPPPGDATAPGGVGFDSTLTQNMPSMGGGAVTTPVAPKPSTVMSPGVVVQSGSAAGRAPADAQPAQGATPSAMPANSAPVGPKILTPDIAAQLKAQAMQSDNPRETFKRLVREGGYVLPTE